MAKDRSVSPSRGLRNARHPFSQPRRVVHDHGPAHRPHAHGNSHGHGGDLESPPPVGAAPHAAVVAADAKAAGSNSDDDDEHEHYAHRAPWLRAGVLGACRKERQGDTPPQKNGGACRRAGKKRQRVRATPSHIAQTQSSETWWGMCQDGLCGFQGTGCLDGALAGTRPSLRISSRPGLLAPQPTSPAPLRSRTCRRTARTGPAPP